MKNFGHAFSFTLYNIRSRFFHTFLSVLGIVIGVAALVIVLSLIDGMEVGAREQVLESTSLNIVAVGSEPFKVVDGVRMRKTDCAVLTLDRFDLLRRQLRRPSASQMFSRYGAEVSNDNSKNIGAIVQFTTEEVLRPDSLLAGRLIGVEDVRTRDSVAVISRALAQRLEPDSTLLDRLIGTDIVIGPGSYTIIGITHTPQESPVVSVPITRMDARQMAEYPPTAFFEAASLEDVIPLQEEIRSWLRTNPVSPTDSLSVISHQSRVEQMTKGFLVFRIVMGFIVGVSVVVGGIGVMNVLLISIAQRRVEIGIRKSVGARKRDILKQFLSESVVISILGSSLGMILGYLAALGIASMIRKIADAPFDASFSLGTLTTVTLLAVTTGILFGTYPATLAARLSPAEAIRQEM